MRGDFDEDEESDDDWLEDDYEPEAVCPDCGCDLFTEEHELDCSYDDEEDDDHEDD
jgi:hypothetical protein